MSNENRSAGNRVRTPSRKSVANRNSSRRGAARGNQNNPQDDRGKGRGGPPTPEEEEKMASLEGAFQELIPEIKRALVGKGYTTPSPIQEQCIPHLLEGRDLLGSAQTGTGKTAAFSLPVLQNLAAQGFRRREKGTPQVLIIAPTRELASQIGDNIQTYARHLPIRHTVIFGGVKQFRQVNALNQGIDILVATPGRLLDLMEQEFIHLDQVGVFILDEMDQMLDMGFIHDIKRVLKHVPRDRQTLFFSATMAPKMVQLAQTMVTDPVRISIKPDKPAVERIEQEVRFVSKQDKNALLVDLMKDREFSRVIVFTQMKHMANKVVEKLEQSGIAAAAIHGNKSQAARTKALTGFKSGKFRALVATDVAARGIDVREVTHVFNYDLPVEAETYVHRIGRTARAGSEGRAISFCCAEERAYLTAIEKLLKEPVPENRDHDYHCEASRKSKLPPPKQGGGGRGRRGGGGGGRGGRFGGGGGGNRGGGRGGYRGGGGGGGNRSNRRSTNRGR